MEQKNRMKQIASCEQVFNPIRSGLFWLFKGPGGGGSSKTPLKSQEPLKLAERNFAQ